MPATKRIKTDFPGVYYVESFDKDSGKPDKVYYIRYRRGQKQYEERVGSKVLENMTAAQAAAKRNQKINRTKTAINNPLEPDPHNPPSSHRWTIDRLWNTYAEQRKKTRSFASDISRYNKFIKPNFGNIELTSLMPAEIRKFRASLLKNKSPQTVKHILGLLVRLNRFSIRNNLAPGISFSIEMPEVSNKKTEELTSEQLSSLLRSIEESKHTIAAAMMKTALFTGMRRGEMFRLRWEDINFEDGHIHLPGANDSVHIIPLNDSARNVLTALPRTSKFVFPHRDGGQLKTVTREVNEIKDAAGLPKDFRPLQGLRHTYATLLASSGKVDMYTLQKLLAHKSPQMTQRYAHLRDEVLQKAAQEAATIIDQAIKIEGEQTSPKMEQKSLPLDINQYDITKKKIKKTKQKKIDKGEKKTITKVKQLKIPGLG